MSLQPQKDKKKLDSSQAVVRLSRCGKRFEVVVKREPVARLKEAQKRAKKEGTEGPKIEASQLDDYLDVRVVFGNVTKGDAVKEKELETIFQVPEFKEIEAPQTLQKALLVILLRGELQTSEADRREHVQGESKLLREVSEAVARKVYIPAEKGKKEERVGRYTPDQVERMLKNVEFRPKPGRSHEALTLDAIRAIRDADEAPVQRHQLLYTLVNIPEQMSKDLLEALARHPGYTLPMETASGKKKTLRFLLDPDLQTDLEKEFPFLKDPKACVCEKDVLWEDGDLTLCVEPSAGSAPEGQEEKKDTSRGGQKKAKDIRQKAKKDDDSDGGKDRKFKDLRADLGGFVGGDDERDPGAMYMSRMKDRKKKGKRQTGGDSDEEGSPKPSKEEQPVPLSKPKDSKRDQDDDKDEEPSGKAARKKGKPESDEEEAESKRKPTKKGRGADSDDEEKGKKDKRRGKSAYSDDDDDVPPKKEAPGKSLKGKKKGRGSDSEEDSEEEAVKKKSSAKPKRGAKDEDSDEDEPPARKTSAKAKQGRKADESDDEDSRRKPSAGKKGKNAKPASSDEEEEAHKKASGKAKKEVQGPQRRRRRGPKGSEGQEEVKGRQR
eukprot:RCo032813